MNKNDEAELHRLTNLLSKINDKFELTTDSKEALEKAALALSVSFIHGHRKEIEKLYLSHDDQLTEDQKQYLR
jgi:hypothetical protein